MTEEKKKMVEWLTNRHYYNPNKPEGYEGDCVTVINRITTEDAIILQKAKMKLDNKIHNRGFCYESDEMALSDFIIENWGKIIEVE